MTLPYVKRSMFCFHTMEVNGVHQSVVWLLKVSFCFAEKVIQVFLTVFTQNTLKTELYLVHREQVFANCYVPFVYLFVIFPYVCVSGEKYQVLDSCCRSMLRTEDMEDQGQMLACTFVLKLLENQEDREVSYMLKTESM